MNEETNHRQTQGVCPDIVTLGKPMGNGFPLGGLVVRREIAQAFANGMVSLCGVPRVHTRLLAVP